MEGLKVNLLPESYLEFARKVAELAEANGIKTCQIKIIPNFADKYRIPDVSLHGEVTINCSFVDSRGRPDKKLQIFLNASVNHTLENAQHD